MTAVVGTYIVRPVSIAGKVMVVIKDEQNAEEKYQDIMAPFKAVRRSPLLNRRPELLSRIRLDRVHHKWLLLRKPCHVLQE